MGRSLRDVGRAGCQGAVRVRFRRGACGGLQQALQNGFQGGADDGFGEFAGGVVGTGAPPFLAGLQHHAAGGHQARRGLPVDDGVQGGVQRLQGFGVAHGLPHPFRGLAVGAVLQPLAALGRRFLQQRLQIHRGRCPVLLGGLDGDGASRGGLQPKAHHGLIDGADVLHVQGPVGDALPV